MTWASMRWTLAAWTSHGGSNQQPPFTPPIWTPPVWSVLWGRLPKSASRSGEPPPTVRAAIIRLLNRSLRNLQLRQRSIRTIVLCGIATNMGVESTARFAYEYGYQQLFAEDAMG